MLNNNSKGKKNLMGKPSPLNLGKGPQNRKIIIAIILIAIKIRAINFTY